jgi:hypothetical protein
MSDEKKVMCHAFLVSFYHGQGFGNLINYREVGVATARPSAEDIESIMSKVAKKNGMPEGSCLALSVSELQDEMVPVSQLDF